MSGSSSRQTTPRHKSSPEALDGLARSAEVLDERRRFRGRPTGFFLVEGIEREDEGIEREDDNSDSSTLIVVPSASTFSMETIWAGLKCRASNLILRFCWAFRKVRGSVTRCLVDYE